MASYATRRLVSSQDGCLAPLVGRRRAAGDVANENEVLDGVEVVEHAVISDAQTPVKSVLVEPFGFGVAEGVTREHLKRGADCVAVVSGEAVELLRGRFCEAYRPERGRVHTRRG